MATISNNDYIHDCVEEAKKSYGKPDDIKRTWRSDVLGEFDYRYSVHKWYPEVFAKYDDNPFGLFDLNKAQIKGFDYALDELPEEDRTAILLRYRDECPITGIMEKMGLTDARVKSVITDGIYRIQYFPTRLGYIVKGCNRKPKPFDIYEEYKSKKWLGNDLQLFTFYLNGDLTRRDVNAYEQNGIYWIEQLIKKIESDPVNWTRHLDGIGKGSKQHVYELLDKLGVDHPIY